MQLQSNVRISLALRPAIMNDINHSTNYSGKKYLLAALENTTLYLSS